VIIRFICWTAPAVTRIITKPISKAKDRARMSIIILERTLSRPCPCRSVLDNNIRKEAAGFKEAPVSFPCILIFTALGPWGV
jgi:hypothetical protein